MTARPMPGGEQDAAALARIAGDVRTTLVVEASAGTGKTFALVTRVLALLRSGVPLRQIAVMTFLRAAAEELRVRLADALARETAPWARRAEADLPAAFLGTIHAFAERLLREEGLEAGLDPGARILSEVEAELARLEAFRAFLAERAVADPEPLTEARLLGTTLGPEALYRMAAVLQDGAARPDPPSMAAVEAAAHAVLGALDRLDSVARAVGPGLRDAADTAWQAAMRLLETRERLTVAAREGRLRDVALLAAPKAGRMGQQGHYRTAADLAALRDAMGGVRQARDAFREVYGAAVATRLLLWLAPFPAYARARREAAGTLTQDDLLACALRLLDVMRVRQRVAARYRYILVDEGQDSDPVQLAILDRLGVAEAGRLFVVGDPKQAIYGFRGADLAGYQRWVARLGPELRLRLTISRRSRPSLVAALNRLCGPVLASQGVSDPPLRPDPAIASEEEDAASALPPVHILAVPTGDAADDTRVREARAIAAFVASVLGRWHVRRRDGTQTPLGPADIAVLARRREAFGQIAAALAEVGVAAGATRDRALWRQPVAQDLLRILGALVRPASPVAVAAALRCGLVGWSDQDLFAYRAAGGRFNLLEIAQTAVTAVPPFAARALTVLAAAARDVDRPVPQRLADLERDLDLPGAAVLLGGTRALRLLRQAREALDALSYDASGTPRTLEEVLRAARDLGSCSDERATEAIASAARADVARAEVRLLTVHEAKGLEFPVVVLCDLDHEARPASSGLLAAADAQGVRHEAFVLGVERWEDGIATAATPGAAEVVAARAQSAREELARLWYVAVTRARDALVLCDAPSATIRRSPERASFAGLLLAAAASVTGGAVPGPDLAAALAGLGVCAVVHPSPQILPSEGALGVRPALRAADLTAPTAVTAARDALVQGTAGALAIVRPSVLAERERGTAGAWADRGGLVPEDEATSARVLGRMTHDVLARYLGAPDVLPDPGTETARLEALVRRAVARGGGELGGAGTDPHAAVQALVERALATPLVRRILAAPRRRTEVEVTARMGGRLILGRVDLLFEDTDGRLCAVDFKTDRVPETADEAALFALAERHGYLDQVRAYAQALRLAGPAPLAAAYLLFVRVGRAVAVPLGDASDAWDAAGAPGS